MSFLLTILSSHLLSILETELAAQEPKLVALLCQEIDLLIAKLQHMITTKEPLAAAVANPLLSLANKAMDVGVNAAGVVLSQQA